MRPGPKLLAYAFVLGAALGGGAAVGAVVGPIDVGEDAQQVKHDAPAVEHGGDTDP
jgi:hypothetical protein